MMEKEQIYNVLTERGYDAKSANVIIPELQVLTPPLDTYFEQWVNNESDTHDYVSSGYSIKQLMEERGMTYPAALLTMDWLIKEPEAAMGSLNRGVR